ncbi:MAG TPA: hypothetical protein VLA56_16980 [Pseudomonadales bacterium]|nr:hypothetical protein [Pseudomonadales bacterium]
MSGSTTNADASSVAPIARLSVLALLLMLGGCAVLRPAGEGAGGADSADAVYEQFPPGAPQRCIAVNDVRKIDTVGEHTLLFYSRSGEVWRNRLRRLCPGLERDTILSYDLQTSRLCANDLVYQLDRWGDDLRRGIACSLGEFDYLTEDQAEALKQYH